MHQEMIPQVRDAIRFRYRLMPYLYTLMARATRDNEPVVRPLLYDFPEDRVAIPIDDSFMLGPDLLVAPVLEEGDREREIYLPSHPGGWFDLRTGEHYEGGRVARVAAPLGRLPIWARAGAMVPVSDQLDGIDPARDTSRTLLVFGDPADTSIAELYEDDGDTTDWQANGLRVDFRSRRDGDRLAVSAEAQGTYKPAFDQIVVQRVGAGRPLRIGTAPGTLPLVIGP